ncbi:hypothetical protein ACRAWF_31425 [Streptomyces sp. L7]
MPTPTTSAPSPRPWWPRTACGRRLFKTGAGGQAVEYLGERERPVGTQGRMLQRALGVYLGRR